MMQALKFLKLSDPKNIGLLRRSFIENKAYCVCTMEIGIKIYA